MANFILSEIKRVTVHEAPKTSRECTASARILEEQREKLEEIAAELGDTKSNLISKAITVLLIYYPLFDGLITYQKDIRGILSTMMSLDGVRHGKK